MRDQTVEQTSTDELDSLTDGSGGAARELLGLVILWSREEPTRVGEVALLPRLAGIRWVLGRQAPVAPQRLGFFRQRPGQNCATGELAASRLSRDQLTLSLDGDSLEVSNVGRRPMLVNGLGLSQARLSPGDLLEIEQQLLLMCVSRPETLPTGRGADGPHHEFGMADKDGIVGESPAVWQLRQQTCFCGQTPGHVLIHGPSGAGKELIARAIHRHTAPDREMVSRNAATFPEGILDAELFGNLKDYPNPGIPSRPGAIGEADGSTLFLDEIGEISHAMQAHLLRVLDQGEYQRLGESRRRQAIFRLIGATNRPLDSLKHDFLARFPRRIALIGLEDRPEDIPLLAQHLLRSFAEQQPSLFAGQIPLLHPRLVKGLVLHRYSTHVREVGRLLWQAIEAWHTRGGGKYLDLDLPIEHLPARPVPVPETLTREAILDAYRRFDGLQAPIPAHLGLRDRFQLGRLEKKLGISAEDKRRAVAHPDASK